MPFFLCGTTPGYFLNISLPAYFTGFVLAAMLLALTVQSFLSGTRMTRRQWQNRRERLDHERQLASSDASVRRGETLDAQTAGTTLSDTLKGSGTEESSRQHLQAVLSPEPQTDNITHVQEGPNEPSTFRNSVPPLSDLEAAALSSTHSRGQLGRMFRHRTVRAHPDQVRTRATSSSESKNSNGMSLVMASSSTNPALGNAQGAFPASADQHALGGTAAQLQHDDQPTCEACQNESVTAGDGATFIPGLRRSISFQDTDLATRRHLPRDDSVASCLTLRPRGRHSHSGVLRTASLYEDLAGLYTVHIDEPERRSRSKTTSTDRTESIHVDELNLMDSQRSKRGRFWRLLDPVLFSRNLEEMLEAERPWFPWRHIVFLVFLVLILFVCQFLSGAPYARSPVGVQLCGAVFWIIFTIQELALFSLGVLTVFRNLRLRGLRAEYGYPWFEHDGLTDMRWDGRNLYVYPAFIIVIGAIDSWTGLSSSALIIPYLYLIARTDLVTVQSSMAVVNLVASLAAAMVFLVDGRLNVGYSLFFGLWAMLGSYCGVFFVYYLVDRFQVRGFIILAISIAFLTATAIVLYEAIHNVLAAQAANVGWQMVNICKATYL
ncbi:hypothetical protein F1559_001848 [Cyanidiococcus yangmingshanensis]|uniref:Transmembrane protein n=1 Tax=Cyanidiococcus yangmingshanensis TaxID=2690220 RepID=A0A7J7IMS5_9RHOD|nr:hypothetical protein F1559_001848 [Cyanidiococcus yangmingshanensis]